MKIKTLPSIIAAAISALLAYALYVICKTDGLELLITIGGFICFFLTLATGIAVRFEQERASVNTVVLGWLFFFLMLVSHAIFSFIQFSIPIYIIVNGLILLLFIGITYAVSKAKQ